MRVEVVIPYTGAYKAFVQGIEREVIKIRRKVPKEALLIKKGRITTVVGKGFIQVDTSNYLLDYSKVIGEVDIPSDLYAALVLIGRSIKMSFEKIWYSNYVEGEKVIKYQEPYTEIGSQFIEIPNAGIYMSRVDTVTEVGRGTIYMPEGTLTFANPEDIKLVESEISFTLENLRI